MRQRADDGRGLLNITSKAMWDGLIERLRRIGEHFSISRSFDEEYQEQQVICEFSLDEEGLLVCHQPRCPRRLAASHRSASSFKHASDHIGFYHAPPKKKAASGGSNKAAGRTQRGLASFFGAKPSSVELW